MVARLTASGIRFNEDGLRERALDLRAVERPVLYGFGRVVDGDGVPAVEVRDRPRDFEHAVIPAGRESQPVDSLLEESGDRRRRSTKRPHLCGTHMTVRVDADAIAETRALDVASPPDSAANLTTPGAARSPRQRIERHGRHGNVEVDPV